MPQLTEVSEGTRRVTPFKGKGGPAEVVAGSKRCAKCKKVKPLACFSGRSRSRDGKQSSCKRCHYLYRSEWLARPETKAARRAYAARPEVKAANAAAKRAYYHTPRCQARTVAYRLSARGRTLRCLAYYRKHTGPLLDWGKRERYEALAAQAVALLERLKLKTAAKGGDDDS